MNAVRGSGPGAPLSILSPTSNLIWPVCLRKLRNVVLVKEMEALKVAAILRRRTHGNNGILSTGGISSHSRMGSYISPGQGCLKNGGYLIKTVSSQCCTVCSQGDFLLQ